VIRLEAIATSAAVGGPPLVWVPTDVLISIRAPDSFAKT
jgi:hypothetical protein